MGVVNKLVSVPTRSGGVDCANLHPFTWSKISMVVGSDCKCHQWTTRTHSRVSVMLLLYSDVGHRFHGLAKIMSTTVAATTIGTKYGCVITITSVCFALRIVQSPFVCRFNYYT